MSRLVLVPAILTLTAGCMFGDKDNDGLANGREGKFGADKEVWDTDGDGLRDGEEVDLGTSPSQFDTDGDGYGDGDELAFGTDPLDNDDLIYEGGWPYNGAKEDLGDPGFSGRVQIGSQIPNLVTFDQYGDPVELYDYAGHGKLVIIDISAEWCPPCQGMASWLQTGQDPGMGLAQFDDVRGAVDDGDIYWVTVMAEDTTGGPATQDAVQRWADRFPHPEVPVIADTEAKEMTRYMGLEFYPALWIIDENMEALTIGGDYQAALAFAQAELD